jgi:aminoglycoside phosphotransferase (APT) family kinase protein
MSEARMEAPRRSTRDREDLRRRLEAWLAGRLPAGAAPQVPALSSPAGSGMSSETLLFDAEWSEAGERRSVSLVARLAPDAADVPVFPSYDLATQFRLLRLVAEHGSVPVPQVRWLENDAGVLGAPFFVMDRVEGRVPSDIPPYDFAGWVLEASPQDRERLQAGTVRAIAALHAIDASRADFLAFALPGDTALRRHVENQRRYYAWVTQDGTTHPVIERTFAWLEAQWPSEGETVISWGDARIGNVLYAGFEPAALLDWEMAALAPREVDLGWLAFMHAFFEDLAGKFGLPGLPGFLRARDVAATYAEASGLPAPDLRWYEVYAALRHAIVMARIKRRMIHFGEGEWGADPDEAIPHAGLLQRMLDGSYWK